MVRNHNICKKKWKINKIDGNKHRKSAKLEKITETSTNRADSLQKSAKSADFQQKSAKSAVFQQKSTNPADFWQKFQKKHWDQEQYCEERWKSVKFFDIPVQVINNSCVELLKTLNTVYSVWWKQESIDISKLFNRPRRFRSIYFSFLIDFVKILKVDNRADKSISWKSV